eukprot:6221293-Alexandrium_andersonii.AAC.1
MGGPLREGCRPPGHPDWRLLRGLPHPGGCRALGFLRPAPPARAASLGVLPSRRSAPDWRLWHGLPHR